MTALRPLVLAALALGAAPAPAADRADGVKAVVRAVSAKAAELAGNPKRPTGDALTAEYVRSAASAALRLPDADRVPAFLVGLGVALDDSTVLRGNPLTGKAVRAAETPAERAARVKALGAPTVRGRRDLCQHFAVSVTLAELLGPDAAEAAGVAKELLDARGPSGFSFSDVAADFAGVAFARRLTAEPKELAGVAERFAVADWVPDVPGLADGLTAAKLAADYGGGDDPRFRAALADIKKRVDDAPGHKK